MLGVGKEAGRREPKMLGPAGQRSVRQEGWGGQRGWEENTPGWLPELVQGQRLVQAEEVSVWE